MHHNRIYNLAVAFLSLQAMQEISYQFTDQIKTDYSGYKALAKFYHFCLAQPEGSHIAIDFGEVGFFDGNLCALLFAILYWLKKNRRNTFSHNVAAIGDRLDVFNRNGFLGRNIPDDRKSTVPVEAFDCRDKEKFCSYVDNKLLGHRGIGPMTDVLKQRISDDILEIFGNTNHHANTTDPFFVGGQYFPNMGLLKFTMVDLGDGFLPRIAKATDNVIQTHLEAILWGLKGNSSKMKLENTPGGLGLKNMLKYCRTTKGVLQVISDDGFWSSDLESTIFEDGRTLPQSFVGTTINLVFRKK